MVVPTQPRHSKDNTTVVVILAVITAYIRRQAVAIADTKVSREVRRADALLLPPVKVATATLAAPGAVMVRLVPELTAVSAAAKFAALLFEATSIFSSELVLIEVGTLRTNVTFADRRAAEDVMLMPDK